MADYAVHKEGFVVRGGDHFCVGQEPREDLPVSVLDSHEGECEKTYPCG